MSHYHEQFLKQNPLAVLGVLRDLHKAAIPLRLSWNGGQLISKILAITPDKLVLDFGSQAEDNIAVLKAQHITITAETQGAKVEFTGNDSNLLIVFYVQIMPDDFVMQLHRF